MIEQVKAKKMIEQDFQLNRILSTIARGYHRIGEIARECGGLYPLELQTVLNEFVKQGKINRSTEGYHLVLSSNTKIDAAKSNSLPSFNQSMELPEPHPHDFDWRFDAQTIRNLTEMLIAESFREGSILLFGAPSVFIELTKLHNVPHTTLIDWSPELINRLNQYRLPQSFSAINHNLSSPVLWKSEQQADVVLCDPPWYPEYYAAFLAQAAQATKVGALVAISLFPVNTRPNAVTERWEILAIAQRLGLHPQSIEAGKLGYETPLFESASLRSSGIEIDDNWRKGDLVLFRKVYHPKPEVISEVSASTLVEITEMEKWAEFLIDHYKVKLRGPFDDYSEVPELLSIEKDDILPTVSRRYKRRELIDLWLWDNRVFAVKGKAAFASALHTLTGKPFINSGNKISEANYKRAFELLRKIIGNIDFRVSIQIKKSANGINPDISLLSLLQGELYKNENLLNVEVLTQICSQANIRGHLAILTQPYLDKIIVGKKTIESRFSKMRVPPFYKVQKGDILLLKETAGPIAAIAMVSNVKFFGPLKPRDVELVMEEYSDGLALEEAFTKTKQDSKYATLINIGEVLPVKPLTIAKSDRRAWVVLNAGTQNRLF